MIGGLLVYKHLNSTMDHGPEHMQDRRDRVNPKVWGVSQGAVARAHRPASLPPKLPDQGPQCRNLIGVMT
jgi:hypothetical protein